MRWWAVLGGSMLGWLLLAGCARSRATDAAGEGDGSVEPSGGGTGRGSEQRGPASTALRSAGGSPDEPSGLAAGLVRAGEPGLEGLERGDPPAAREARHELVRRIETRERPWGDSAWSPRVLDAMRRVPRHLFMPGASLASAYRDEPNPIGYGQTISQPTIVAFMSNALQLRGDERVLEIGTGSGYQAAVLSSLCREVYSIELLEPLGRAAASRLGALGYANVHVRIGDGYAGWPEHAPFDRIILTAAPPELPATLVAQLPLGGIIVAPVGTELQTLLRWVKGPDGLREQELGGVRFVPMVPGSGAAPSR